MYSISYRAVDARRGPVSPPIEQLPFIISRDQLIPREAAHHEGAIRIAFYVMLVSHILLAAINLPMILTTLWKAYRKDWAGHRRIARWTFPVWFYVSVTGVLVYFALYRWNAPPPA